MQETRKAREVTQQTYCRAETDAMSRRWIGRRSSA